VKLDIRFFQKTLSRLKDRRMFAIWFFFIGFFDIFWSIYGIWESVEVLDFLAQVGGGFVVSFDYL
jgi:hypothetical protein